MWILPKQLHTSAYVPDTKESGLDLEAFCQTCERSLTWRGKDSLSRTWLQRWKRESWMQHLSSRTLRPSHTESFVDAWTSSLEDSRVSHSQLLESVKLLKTPDTSSPTSQTELESANLELFSLKTYKESSVARQPTENQFSSMSSESWKDWVIEQRQEYSQRKKSAHLIRESESTSLELEKNWATPQTFDSNNLVRTPEKLAQTRAEKNAGCMNLREQVHYPDMDHSRKAAKNWPTVTVGEEKYRIKGNSQASKCLSAMAVRGELGHPDQANPNTNGKSQGSWGTPRTSQAMSATITENLVNRNVGNLEEQQGRQSIGGKLNPNWVEHLMGLPAGWTDLGSWETE